MILEIKKIYKSGSNKNVKKGKKKRRNKEQELLKC